MTADDLSAAWKAVEEVLPEGWEIYDLTRYSYDRDCGGEWRQDEWSARAGRWEERAGFMESRFVNFDFGYGPTPTAALLALRDRLTDTGKENRE